MAKTQHGWRIISHCGTQSYSVLNLTPHCEVCNIVCGAQSVGIVRNTPYIVIYNPITALYLARSQYQDLPLMVKKSQCVTTLNDVTLRNDDVQLKTAL